MKRPTNLVNIKTACTVLPGDTVYSTWFPDRIV